jgi:hypothetical protein
MMDFGDLLFQAMNIPLADKISERFRRLANPAALGIGPTPQEQQLQQLLQQQHQVLAQQAQEIQALKSKALVQETQKEIDEQKVMNDRFKIIADKYPQVLEPIVKTWASTLVGMPINQLIQQHMIENSQMIAAANPMPSPPQNPQQPQ